MTQPAATDLQDWWHLNLVDVAHFESEFLVAVFKLSAMRRLPFLRTIQKAELLHKHHHCSNLCRMGPQLCFIPAIWYVPLSTAFALEKHQAQYKVKQPLLNWFKTMKKNILMMLIQACDCKMSQKLHLQAPASTQNQWGTADQDKD